MSPDLEALIKQVVARGVTEEELRQQRRSYVSSEMAMGSDADESAYRDGLERNDKETLARLEAEGEVRRQRALKWFDEHYPAAKI